MPSTRPFPSTGSGKERGPEDRARQLLEGPTAASSAATRLPPPSHTRGCDQGFGFWAPSCRAASSLDAAGVQAWLRPLGCDGLFAVVASVRARKSVAGVAQGLVTRSKAGIGIGAWGRLPRCSRLRGVMLFYI